MWEIGNPSNVVVSPDTHDLLAQIDSSIRTFEALRPFDEETERRIKTAFLPDRVTSSLNMEGIVATRRQTLAIMDAMTIAENATKTEVEILNALRADELTFDQAMSGTALSESFVREVNALIEDGVGDAPGSYRPRDVQITQAAFIPPNHLAVPSLVHELIKTYNETKNVHTVVRAVWLHARFTYIHPFLDGNGRTGRLMQDFCLLSGGLFPTGIPSSKRDDYYDALSEADQNRWDQLIQIVAFRELDVIARATAIANERKQRTDWITALAKSASTKKARSQHKNYLVWSHKMSGIRSLFEETARELSEATDLIYVRHQNYDLIDFATWKEVCERGQSNRTWAFSQQIFLEGEFVLNYIFFFRRHRNQTADPFAPADSLVSLFCTGGDAGQMYDFARFNDPDIKLREIVFFHEDMFAYRATGRMTGYFEETSPAPADSPSDLVREFYEDIFRRKLGI